MQGNGGILKHLIWIVPLTMFVLWYVTQQQHVQQDIMQKDSAKFDEQFNRAWSAAGGDSLEDKKAWKADEKEAKTDYNKAKKRSEDSQAKSDESFNQMEKELKDASFDDSKNPQK